MLVGNIDGGKQHRCQKGMLEALASGGMIVA